MGSELTPQQPADTEATDLGGAARNSPADAFFPTPITVADALNQARTAGLDRLDAQLIVCSVLGVSRSWVLAHDRDPLPTEHLPRLLDWLRRRAAGEPFAYLQGEKEFFGLTLRVTPDTLIPRPDTETLVQWALELLPATEPREVVDLGTGSGAIALALQQQRPLARVSAVDVSADALAVAQTNAERLKLAVHFIQSHWLQSVEGTFDLIVSNPPYIRTDDPHLAALRHEPLQALASGPDGLDDIRTIIEQAPARLKRGSWLLLEHGYDQAASVRNLFTRAGWKNVQSRQDLAGIERCTGAQYASTHLAGA